MYILLIYTNIWRDDTGKHQNALTIFKVNKFFLQNPFNNYKLKLNYHFHKTIAFVKNKQQTRSIKICMQS